MMISTTTQTRKKNKIKLWTIAFWLLLWQFASMALDRQILLASPLSVGRCLLSLVRTFSFWESIWFSLERIALGFFCAAAGGVLLSALAYHVKLIRDILALPVAVLKATPVASFIVLVLIWMPSGNLSILISFIMAFPIIYTNLLEGFEHLDRELFEMAKIFRMTFWNKMYYLYFGGLFAYFRSACAIAIGMCFKAGIAAEIIGIPKGSIGENLYNAKIYLETPDLFAWTFVIIAVSVLFEKIFQWLLSLLAKYSDKTESEWNELIEHWHNSPSINCSLQEYLALNDIVENYITSRGNDPTVALTLKDRLSKYLYVNFEKYDN